MNVRIQTQGFTLTPAIAAWTHDRLSRSLQRFSEEITSVDVYLKDINGPKGGEDKQALVRVQLRSGSPVFVETPHADMYAAIDLSARRTQRTVRRLLKKKIRLARGDSRRVRYLQALMAEL